MGMDIVKRIAVDTLGGELALETSLGVGTTFRMRIPLSISILEALSIEAGGQTFVTPLSMVEEIVELAVAEVFPGPSSPNHAQAEAKLLRRRGETIPLFELRDVFMLARTESAHHVRSAIVVKRQSQSYAFAVDRMLGQQEVVIRPLEDPLVKVPYVSGTTDLGDGLPTLVLDLSSLSRTVTMPDRHRSRAQPSASSEVA
jgi:two-component system chemotaxis sensor kinase CheA